MNFADRRNDWNAYKEEEEFIRGSIQRINSLNGVDGSLSSVWVLSCAVVVGRRSTASVCRTFLGSTKTAEDGATKELDFRSLGICL